MGLSERRAAKAYEENTYPALKKRINEAAGFDVPIDVHWDKIACDGEADRYQQDYYFTNTYFTLLIDAFTKIAGDAMGKQALQKGLKKVVITYDAQPRRHRTTKRAGHSRMAC